MKIRYPQCQNGTDFKGCVRVELRDVLEQKDDEVCLYESQMAVRHGALQTSPLIYCGALALSQDGKNFLAHIFPPKDYKDAQVIADALIAHFKPPFHLRYVLGNSEDYNQVSYNIIEDVMRLLREQKYEVTLDKVGEVQYGAVTLDAKGNISGQCLHPCLMTDDKSDIEYNGVTYAFNKRVKYKGVLYIGLDLCVHEGAVLEGEFMRRAIAVLDPQNGTHSRDFKSSATCAIYTPRAKAVGL